MPANIVELPNAAMDGAAPNKKSKLPAKNLPSGPHGSPQAPTPRLVPIKKVAELLGCSSVTVRRRVAVCETATPEVLCHRKQMIPWRDWLGCSPARLPTSS